MRYHAMRFDAVRVKRVFLCTADGLGQVVGFGDEGLGMPIRREGWWWDLAVEMCDGFLLVMGFYQR